MTRTIQVWPKPGATVIDPETGRPVTDGQTVRASRYMMRRVADGDLLEEKPPSKSANPKPKSAGGKRTGGEQ